MLLHKKPEPNPDSTYILTTYATRLRQLPIKEVEITIKTVQEKLAANISAIPDREKTPLVQRSLKTGRTLDLPAQATGQVVDLDTKKSISVAEAMKTGVLVPPGYLCSAEFGQPIIDYSIAYPKGSQTQGTTARPEGWPVLRMLYPVAIASLPAAEDGAGTETTSPIKKGDLVYTLKESGLSDEAIQASGEPTGYRHTASLPR
jgi:hypothetical protein